MQSFEKQSLFVPYYQIRSDAEILSSIQMYIHDFHLTTNQFEKFFEAYKSYFELMAQAMYSKL